jgi:hypothetical protein
METQTLTDRQIEFLARDAGYIVYPPKGGDIYFAIWDSKNCFLVATGNWIRQRATAQTYIALLESERALPRFYR